MASSANPLRVAVIMAGGSGERFWPLSRRERPKQLLPLTHATRSMLEDSASLLEPIIPPQRIFVVTSQHMVEPIRRGQSLIPPENVLGEPEKRNTSGCLAYAAAYLQAHFHEDPESIVMAVATADHCIGDPEAYRATVLAALEAVERQPVLGVIGIRPTRPETGYGYIEIPPGAKPLPGSSESRPTYPVARFREKPSSEMAERLLSTGRCYWNSGLFFWRLSVFLAEAELASPDLARSIRAMAEAIRQDDSDRLQAVFAVLEDLPIDIAVMERARRVVATLGDFPWDDVGSWDALHRLHPQDENGNVAIGDPVLVDARNCVVYNDSSAGNMAVAVIGVEGLAVVATRDGVLVVPRDRAQDVRRAVAELRRRGAAQL